MNFLNNKSFCTMAWTHIASHTDGSARLCCVSNRFIKKNNNENFNLGKDNIVDIINSDDFNKIRKDMINGDYIEGCETCYQSEQYTRSSLRTRNNTKWLNNKNFKNKLLQTQNNIPLDNTVEFFDIRFGNLCNLSCRYCFSEVSSTYNKEAKEINEKFVIKPFATIDQDYDQWFETETFFKNVQEQIPNLEKYYAAGGEPTLADKNYELMKHMVDTGHSKHIELQISTNLTNTKKDFYSLLPYFKKIIFLASIDGLGTIQEYMRYPSKWEQIEKNLHKVIALNIPNLEITFTPVIQKINLEYLVDLFDYAENLNKQYNKGIIQVAPIMLSQPDYYDMLYLPQEYKQYCYEKIYNWIKNNCKFQGVLFYSRIEMIKKKCLENVDYQNNLKTFFKYTDILDTHRNHSLKDVNPKLESYRDK